MLACILSSSPLTQQIVEHLQLNPPPKITTRDYCGAQLLATLVKTYWTAAQKAVARLLSCIPEANVAEGEDFYQYLLKLHNQ